MNKFNKRKQVFRVMQGCFTKSGTGNEWCTASFNSLEKAEKVFNQIKSDLRGIFRPPYGYLLTYIEEQFWNEEEEDYTREEDSDPIIINSFIIHFNKYGFPSIENEAGSDENI